MSERSPSADPLPIQGGELAADGQAPILDSSLASNDGHTVPMEAVPGDVTTGPIAGAAPEVAPSEGSGTSFMDQSRESFRDARERGTQSARRLGASAVSRVVQFGKKRAERTMQNLDSRWEKRKTEREEERRDQTMARVDRRNERSAQKQKKELDRIADRLETRISKRTMTRKEFGEYKAQKQTKREQEKAQEIAQKQKARQDDKQLRRNISIAQHNRKDVDKAAAARGKAELDAAYRMNRDFDKTSKWERQAQERIDRLTNPEAFREADKQRRQERVQRAKRTGAKVVQVAVGAGAVGGEFAAKHSKGVVEAIGSDERVKYAKLRAELGWAAVRSTLESVSTSSRAWLREGFNISNAELAAFINNGELPGSEGAEVQVVLHDDGSFDKKED
jgi:hypothetical protein